MSEHSQPSSGQPTPASASPPRSYSHSSGQPTPASPCSQSSVQPTPASASPPCNQSSGQPTSPPPPQPKNYDGQWSTGVCDCMDNVTNCCITLWCPCITFEQIAEIVDEGTTSCEVHAVLYTLVLLVTGCQCIYSCIYRSKMRKQYMLPGDPFCDCLLHLFCESCVLCQEYRELKNRGFDMWHGWHESMVRKNNVVLTPPCAPAGMKR
ncbi:protein PLANT CADMIUM RESISTANCE 2-like [Bidens hawaiensis]|uniref:protein PLANT CADMIUM RESISTANCE 2-like n=1 Tax=Bidens hawaiensis TaxID=980011 RepID=UPI00404941DA